jgi:hypothetical protein
MYVHVYMVLGRTDPLLEKRPRNKQRVQPLLCNRRINKRRFLSSGSETGSRGNKHSRNIRRTEFSMWSAPRSYLEDN